LAGRHEPGGGGSFYLSLATAALRAVLVLAAVILGVFVLSKAFPSDGQTAAPVTPDQTEPTQSPATTPTPTEDQGGGGGGGGGGGAPEPLDPAEVQMQILNGTDVSGLAADTQVVLEGEGYEVVTVGDAQNKPVERTIITFGRRFRGNAEELQTQFFPDADLQVAAPDADADITVTLGVDYAEAQGG
jgi:LytR cell envelope-related transcriptional attenuator